MMFNSIQVSFAERIQEVRALHQIISGLESKDPQQPDSTRVIILRGVFYVLLYASFEFAVNQIVSAALREVACSGVQNAKLEKPIFSLALNDELLSLETGVGKKKWDRRIRLFEAQSQMRSVKITDSLFAPYLQNIDRESLEKVFACFGIKNSVVPDPKYFGYIEEIVEKRRAVSHGRISAEDAGRGFRSSDLLKRLDAVTDVVIHLQKIFEDYILKKMYMAENYR